MNLLQFASFTFPNNPESYRMTFQRDYTVKALSGGGWSASPGSRLARKIECEGVFYGSDAHQSFSALASLFLSATSGVLRHPKWNEMSAFIAELEALEEPGEQLVRYRIVFIELPTA